MDVGAAKAPTIRRSQTCNQISSGNAGLSWLPPSIHQRAAATSQSCGKINRNRPAPKGGLLFLHYLDVLPPDGSCRFTQSECPLGQLQIVYCKRHQIFGLARLTTLLGEPYAPFG